MSNSSLVTYKRIVSHKNIGRGGKSIQKIFVHHMAGNLTVKQCGNVFANRQASAHYGVNGNAIGQYVDEKDTAWHCGNYNWNQRSIGIELANDGGSSTGWHVSETTIKTAIKLIADICKRNGIKKLTYTGDMSGNLCMHRWVSATACPGSYLSKQFSRIAKDVNKLLSDSTVDAQLYRVRKSWKDTKSQLGAYRVLANAKDICDKHPGYTVYDKAGKAVYTSVKEPTVTEKLLSACKAQAEWMKNYKYQWEKNPTIEKSKKKGTCVTYVACVLQRISYLKSGEHIWNNGKGFGTGKVYGTNEKMTVTYMGNKSLTALKDKLKAGDIVMVDDNKSGKSGNGGHIFILTGKWTAAGNPYIWDNHSCEKVRQGKSGAYAYNGKRKVLAIVRLK